MQRHFSITTHRSGLRSKNRLLRARALRREQRVVSAARVVIANSDLTRRHEIDHIGLDPSRVITVALGSDPGFGRATGAERESARKWLGVSPDRHMAVFVGALGYDNRKGFETLWEAWRSLCADPRWDVDLVAVGGGRRVMHWTSEVRNAGLSQRVRMMGFTDRVRDLLAAADLLVSPSRYESYGLNVHEAVCRGLPAIVSRCAGLAGRYPPALDELLLEDPSSVRTLVDSLRRWRRDVTGWKAKFSSLGAMFRSRSWTDMAAELVSVVENPERDSALST